MEHNRIIQRLEAFGRALPSVVAGLSDRDVRWKPAPQHWSILEVCCHLLDEEREDFRARLRSTVEDPSRAWPALDLEGIAEKRSYNTRDLRSVITEFADERAASVAWPATLGPSDWDRAYRHPKVGLLPAAELLTAWAAHDALHLRQIAKRLFELAAADGAPHATKYAGDWGP